MHHRLMITVCLAVSGDLAQRVGNVKSAEEADAILKELVLDGATVHNLDTVSYEPPGPVSNEELDLALEQVDFGMVFKAAQKLLVQTAQTSMEIAPRILVPNGSVRH